MLKGVIFGLIWGIVTISLMVVAIGLGIPPEPEEDISVAATEGGATSDPSPRPDSILAPGERPSLLTDAPREVTGADPAPVAVAAAPNQIAAETDADAVPVLPGADTNLPTHDQPLIVAGAGAGQSDPVPMPEIDSAAAPRPPLDAPQAAVAPPQPSEAPAVALATDTAPATAHTPLSEPIGAEQPVAAEAAKPAVPPLPVPVVVTEAPMPGPVHPEAETETAMTDPRPAADAAEQPWPPLSGAVMLNTQDRPEAPPRSGQPSRPSVASPVTTAQLPRRIEMEADGAAIQGADPAARDNAAGDDVVRTGFRRTVSGVRTDRLPTIGGEATANPAPNVSPAANADPTLPNVPLAEAGETPLTRNMRPFVNPANLPMIAIVLTPAEGGVDSGTIQSLSFPVTVALDPLAESAATRAGEYKAAGAELLILAGALPGGATASDVEVSFAGYFASIDNAVGVIDRPEGGFAAEMLQAKQVAAILADEGYGLVTYSRGLNSAAREAARLGLPAVQVTRVLDEDATDPQALRRALDRAAFDASQTGGIVLTAAALPENVAAIAAWVQDAKDVAIAPVSAVLTAQANAR